MERKLWMGLGAILALLILYLTLPFVNIIIYGLFLYHISRPIYKMIKKRLGNRLFSALVSQFLIVLPLVLIIIYTSAIATAELSGILSDSRIDARGRVAEVISEAQNLVDTVSIHDFVTILRENKNLGDYFYTVGLIAVNLIFTLILSVIAGIIFLIDEGRFRSWAEKSLIPDDEELANKFFTEVDTAIHHVFLGSIMTAGLTALLGVIVFTLLNELAPNQALTVPYPQLLGILSGLANLIPAIGIKLVWIPLFFYISVNAILANILVPSLWFLLVFLVAVNLVVDSIPEYIIRPYTSGGLVDPAILLFAYIFGPLVFGISGLFLGPIIVVTSAAFVKIVVPTLQERGF